MSLLSLDELLSVLGRELDAHKRFAVLAGICLPRWIDRGIAPQQSLHWHLARLQRAHELGQVQVLFDEYGRHAGSIIWTCLDDAAEENMLAKGPDAIDAQQFAKQGNAWMLDLDVRLFLADAILKYTRQLLAAQVDELAYVRIKRRQRIAKRLAGLQRASQQRAATATSTKPFLHTDSGRQLKHEAQAFITAMQQLGECFLLLAQAPSHSAKALSSIGAAIRFPLTLGQCLTTYSAQGQLTGLMSYAWLTQEAQQRLREQGPSALSPSCMNEGETLVGLCGWAVDEAGAAALAAALEQLHSDLPRSFAGAGLPAFCHARLAAEQVSQ